MGLTLLFRVIFMFYIYIYFFQVFLYFLLLFYIIDFFFLFFRKSNGNIITPASKYDEAQSRFNPYYIQRRKINFLSKKKKSKNVEKKVKRIPASKNLRCVNN